MAKLIKTTLKAAASIVVFSMIGLTLINAAVNMDMLSIGSAGVTLWGCDKILCAIWF